jgi:PAS domain S-box-containing protein
MTGTRYTCPCCGFQTFNAPPGSTATCDVCQWRDDLTQLVDPWRLTGLNGLSLASAQAAFSERVLQSFDQATAPIFTHVRDTHWRPAAVGDGLAQSRTGYFSDQKGDWLYYWRRSPSLAPVLRRMMGKDIAGPLAGVQDAMDLKFLEGEVTDWQFAGGYLNVKIGGQPARIHGAQITGNFVNDGRVRVLLRDLPVDGASTLLAWQRIGSDHLHYTGPRPDIRLLVCGLLAAIVGAFFPRIWFALPGVALFGYQLTLLVKKLWTLHVFKSEERWSQAPSQAQAAVTRHIPAAALSELPEQILESTHDAIIIWEMDGRGILYWNRAAEMLYGYSREQAQGRVTHELLKTELAGGVDELETRLARYGVWVGDITHTCADGRRVEVEGRLSLLSQAHSPALILEVNRDVTDRNRAEAARRSMEAQLRRVRSHFVD